MLLERLAGIRTSPLCTCLSRHQSNLKVAVLCTSHNLHHLDAGGLEVDEYGRRSMPSIQYTREGVIVRRLTTGSLMTVCFLYTLGPLNPASPCCRCNTRGTASSYGASPPAAW